MLATTRAHLVPLVLAGPLVACGAGERDAPAATASASADETKPTPEAKPVPVARAKPPAPAQAELPAIGDEPLTNGKPSLAALGQAVVAALDAKDSEALWSLAVSEPEYTRLFGALVSHPNMLRFGPTMAWANQLEDNRDGLRHAIERHGGRGYAFVSLEPTRTEERGGLVIHRAPKLTVKDATGATLELDVIGVAVEHVASKTFLVLTFAD